MESYRHTYTTISAAGVFFLAISGGLVSLLGATAGAWSVSPLPLLTWWGVVFEPLHGFAVKRRNRLRQIEQKLSNIVPGLNEI
jgi:hypothetical protein